MKKLYFVFTLTCSCFFKTQAQTDTLLHPRYHEGVEKHFSLLAAYNGCGYQYAELGLALNAYGVVGHHPLAWALAASCEGRLDRQGLVAPKLSAWIGGGPAFGISLLYYTATKQPGVPCVRPEIGLGLLWFKLSYGYNFAFTGKEFPGINRHCLNMSFLVGLKKIRPEKR